jgi:hypothetical protein
MGAGRTDGEAPLTAANHQNRFAVGMAGNRLALFQR